MNKSLFFQYLLLAMAIISLSSCSKDNTDNLPGYESHLIKSEATATDYMIQILYPDNYDVSKAYPTVYMLDADWYMDEMVDVVRNQYARDFVLIAVGYNGKIKRERDFTFPADKMLKHSGGGNDFIRFINNELLPFVENELNIKSSEETFMGHSLGGYLGLYLMLQEEFPNPFENIIVVSPSLFWSDGYLFELENQYANANNQLNVNLYIAMGELEGLTMNTHFNAFVNRLQSRNYEGFTLVSERLKNRSHQNTPILGFENGLSIIF